MGNITGFIVAIVVAVLGFFGWKSLDSQIDQLQTQLTAAEAEGEGAAALLQRIEAMESAAAPGSNEEFNTLLTPLVGRIDALESAGSTVASQTSDSSDQSDQGLAQRLDARLDSVEQAMDSIGQNLGEEVLNPLMARVDALEAMVASYSEADDSDVSNSLSALAVRLDSLESQAAGLNSLGQRLDRLETAMGDMANDLAENRLEPLETRLAAAETAIGNQAQDDSSGITTSLAQRLGSLETTVGGIQPGLQASALGPLEQRIAELESVMGSMEPGLQPDSLTPLAEKVSALETAVASIEPGIGQQSLVPLMQRIQEVEKAVGGAIASAGSQTDDNLIAGGFEFVDSEIVYFGYNSATVADDGLAALTQFADQITLTSKIVIRGYADSLGSNIYNQNLALRRALNTEKALVEQLRARKIYRNQIIALESAGEESQLVETGDEVENEKNRAVKITLYE